MTLTRIFPPTPQITKEALIRIIRASNTVTWKQKQREENLFYTNCLDVLPECSKGIAESLPHPSKGCCCKKNNLHFHRWRSLNCWNSNPSLCKFAKYSNLELSSIKPSQTFIWNVWVHPKVLNIKEVDETIFPTCVTKSNLHCYTKYGLFSCSVI